MNINIITVGKLKEKYLLDAVKEYQKRLTRYCKINIVEVNEEKGKEPLSKAEITSILELEGKRILQHIHPDSHCFALVIKGKSLSSYDFSENLKKYMTYGKSSFTFIIGGSYGLSEKVIKKAHVSLSFSLFTFPHQLMRVLLLEQLYRAHKIIHGEIYHK